MMQHYDHTTITEEQKIKFVMNPGEWVDLYAITARLGYYPQSRYFGAVTKVLNQMISNGEIETKPGNLPTPFYRLVAPIIDADQDQRDQLTTRLSLRRGK